MFLFCFVLESSLVCDVLWLSIEVITVTSQFVSGCLR